MKKFKIGLLLIIGMFMLPFMVNAEVKPDHEIDEKSNEVKLYIFRGEGCPHCEEALEWLDSIEKEYGDKFQVISYEVWYNSDNSEYMEEVAKARGENPSGVPYIIIGDKTWYGFDESYKSEMLEEIDNEFKKEAKDRYDIKTYVKGGSSSKNSDSGVDTTSLITLLIVVVVIGGIAGGTYFYNKKKES